jgi:hypothetical protein
MRRLLHLCTLLTLAALPALAARTSIVDVLHRADGTTCSGFLAISWASFTSVSNQLIYAGSIQSRVINGAVSVSLEPGTYTVGYQVGPVGCVPTVETWVVPISLTPLSIADVRTLITPTSTAVMTFAQLPACAPSTEGGIRALSDSTTVIWGATITGGGTNHVLTYCNRSHWTVVGK